jgi:hypothetical protein
MASTITSSRIGKGKCMAPFSPVSSILPGQGNIQGIENGGRLGTWNSPCLCFRTLNDDQKLYDKKAGVNLWLLRVPSRGFWTHKSSGRKWMNNSELGHSWCWLRYSFKYVSILVPHFWWFKRDQWILDGQDTAVIQDQGGSQRRMESSMPAWAL